MTRQYSTLTNDAVKHQLERIADKSTPHQVYKEAMTRLGEQLGVAMLSAIQGQQRVYLVTTVEDADFLAFGALNELEPHLASIGFACFWNERKSLFNRPELAVAPILKQYQEPADGVDYLIIMKSIISGGCVVRTNLQNLIQTIQPQHIFIAAPVIHEQAEDLLRQAFTPAIAEKFQFFYFAKDNERTAEGEVIPGIGGMVYERLGFDGEADKNRYTPDIVKQRRQILLAQRRASA